MTTSTTSKPLSVKHEAFCQAYAVSGNATQAYIKAGYPVSEKVAGTNGPRLLEHAGIRERLAKLKESISEEADLTRQEFIKIIGGHAKRGNMAAARLLAECSGWKEPEKIEMKTEVEVGPATLDMLERSANKLASTLSLVAPRTAARIDPE